MKLVLVKYGVNIELHENIVHNIVVENPGAFADIVKVLLGKSNGIEDEVVLSENEKVLSLNKDLVFISNPLMVDVNEKKILTKLYKELQERVFSEFLQEHATINTAIVNFLEEVVSSVPYHLDIKLDLDVTGLLKLFDVKIDSDPENIVELLIDYLRVLKTICGIQVVMFLNIKHYLTKEQLSSLYEFAFYEKLYIINLTGSMSGKIDNERYYIIDEDLCVIEA